MDCFDLSEIQRKFPATARNLASLPDHQNLLQRIWEIEQRWEHFRADPDRSDEVLLLETAQESPPTDAEFDIIYAGGTLGLLHAAVMAVKYNRRVLVFDAHTIGRTHRDWNISNEELQEFVRAGLFTSAELETAVANRYKTGFVKFFDANSRVKSPPLYMKSVLDVAIEADKLLTLAAQKLNATDSKIVDNLRFVRARVLRDKVLVECEESETGERRVFSSKLFVDATGTNSAISRQLNKGRSITHVCPTVGTLAAGFRHGPLENEVDFDVGEILVSTEDSTDGRQLIWEGFPGNRERDEYTTYLFFYDSVESPADKSLLGLFEEYFEKLDGYKSKGPDWRIIKPVFGYIPSVHHHGWNNVKKIAADRVLLVGDAAGLSSPLTFCGFGSHVRNLCKLTSLTELALAEDSLDAAALSVITAYEPRVAQMSSLAEFMRPMPGSKPSDVNETMNSVMHALGALDERISREMFQDRIPFASFRKILTKTAAVHPAVFRLMFDHLGVKGTFWWIANIAEALIQEKKKAV